MASYYVKYNNVDLTNIIRVRAVETTVLPPRENNSIMIWEKPGSIYNSHRYGEREIIVTFLILASRTEYASNPNIMEDRLNTLRSVFKPSEPKPLYLGTTSRFIYAVPEGDFKMTELRYDCYECEITFVCHDPEYYSSTTYSYNNGSSISTYSGDDTSTYVNSLYYRDANIIEINNGGNASAYPIINIGINTDSTAFVQIENETNGNKLLIGNYQTASKTTTATNTLIFHDSMTDPTTWTTELESDSVSEFKDSGRYGCRSLVTTNAGYGLMVSNDTSRAVDGYTWTGCCAKTDLGPCRNFLVQARMNFTNSGSNGDPTELVLSDCWELIDSGETELRYYCDGTSVPVRNSSDLTSGISSFLEKGQLVDPISIKNGWIKLDSGYCHIDSLKKVYYDTTTRTDVFEVYSVKNVIATQDIELRTSPTTDSSESSILATIPAGTVIRIFAEEENGFYKLRIAYKDKMGYIEASKVTEYEGVGVEYSQDEMKTPDETGMGICEVYGWSSDGTKLFKMSLCDENNYYSCVKPAMEVGSTIVLQDNTSIPKQNTLSNNNQLITDDPLANGSENNWNDFYGELGIQRKDGKWKAWVYKIKNGVPVKKLELKEQKINDAPEEALAYISIYMGYSDWARSSASITDIKVTQLTSSDNTSTPAQFMKGDVIKIDCYNNKVYLNDKLFNGVSIDSNFIELINGINLIKFTSDDSYAAMNITFNERYI